MKPGVLRLFIAEFFDYLRPLAAPAIFPLALGALLLTGCAGGSGSSGFLSEDAAITAALAEKNCVGFDGLRICAAQIPTPLGAPTPTGEPENSPGPGSATPTPTFAPASPEIITLDPRRSDSGSIGCTPIGADRCAVSLPFTASGFPPGATFVIATRTSEQSIWMLSLATPLDVGGDQPSFDAHVALDLISTPQSPPLRVQFAVLVFFTPPEPLPTSVGRLADTGADTAHVSEPLPLTTF